MKHKTPLILSLIFAGLPTLNCNKIKEYKSLYQIPQKRTFGITTTQLSEIKQDKDKTNYTVNHFDIYINVVSTGKLDKGLIKYNPKTKYGRDSITYFGNGDLLFKDYVNTEVERYSFYPATVIDVDYTGNSYSVTNAIYTLAYSEDKEDKICLVGFSQIPKIPLMINDTVNLIKKQTSNDKFVKYFLSTKTLSKVQSGQLLNKPLLELVNNLGYLQVIGTRPRKI